MDKNTIIKLNKQGHSNRKIAKLTKINRKTVARYLKDHFEAVESLRDPENDIALLQEEIVSAPVYDSSTRKPRKYTEAIDQYIDEILNQEKVKNSVLGSHKQSLTKVQIHNKLVMAGFKISYSTVAHQISTKLNKSKECFIRQDYEYGDRLEYDFGEVKLVINGATATYHMAVLSSPASDFRWAYLYKNQKKNVFMDSHVRFFEMVQGTYKEVVYDNMRNVVTRFIGRNEKELNEDLIKMSIYYDFDINVTNCFSGNEKGHVEGSVKIIRNHVFAQVYEFNSFEDAQDYLDSQLIKMNEDSNIDEEKAHLQPYKPKLELANITINKVNKYSFVQVENNFYSVPEYLVEKEVSIKSYFDKIIIYSYNNLVCEHKKIDGLNEISIDITHYLKTLLRKPGAIKNSIALKSIPQLKTIYDKYFTANPKKFIEVLMENKDKEVDELINIFQKLTIPSSTVILLDNIVALDTLNQTTRRQIMKYDVLCVRKAAFHAN